MTSPRHGTACADPSRGTPSAFVEVTTFQAFAWNLVKCFGSIVGLNDANLISPSEAELFGAFGGVTNDS